MLRAPVDKNVSITPCATGIWPLFETNPVEGLWPKIPLKKAGILIEPPTSDPMPIGDPPEAKMAASPPEEPPGIRPISVVIQLFDKINQIENLRKKN